MVRIARIVLPEVAHHVTQRGNDRQDIFFSDADRRVYLDLLRQSALLEGLAVSAYCLMTSHVHLVVTPEREDSVARVIGRTHLMYAQYVFKSQNRSGHLWQGRYYSCPLDEAHEHNAAAYVELNPVRAGMVEAPWDYPWSSAPAHCGHGGDPSRLLDLGAWFERKPVPAWRATLDAIAESDAAINLLRRHTRTGRPLGSQSFLNRIEQTLNRSVQPKRAGRPKGAKDTKPRQRTEKPKSKHHRPRNKQ